MRELVRYLLLMLFNKCFCNYNLILVGQHAIFSGIKKWNVHQRASFFCCLSHFLNHFHNKYVNGLNLIQLLLICHSIRRFTFQMRARTKIYCHANEMKKFIYNQWKK